MNKEFNYNYGNYFYHDKFVRERFMISQRLLIPYLKQKVKILDIGCYDGAMLEILKSANPIIDYSGIDADMIALQHAMKRGAKTIQLNFEKTQLPFKKDFFDIIIISEILEHLREPSRILEQARDLLKSSGVLLVSLPNECTLYHRFKVFLGKGIDSEGFEPGYHLHFPTLRQNQEFIARYFRIIETRFWYHLGVGGFLEQLFSLVPHSLIQSAVNFFPNLFARGGIYLCQK